MEEDKSAGGARATDPLYDWWFSVLPALFGAAGERRESAAGTAADAATGAPSDPTAARVSQALKLTQQLVNSVYTAYFGALVGKPAGAPLAAFEELLRDGLVQFGEQLSAMTKTSGGPAGIEAALNGLTGGMTSSFAAVLKPLSTHLERTYGGLADAFGLAPMRELESVGRDLALAVTAQGRAQTEYLDVALNAMRHGVDALIARLAEMGERGESVDTMLALMRLGAKTMDAAVHESMQSPRALEASAEVIRAGLRARQQQQRVVAIASEALNVPTRAEVDEAFREIQELKREVRRLRKAVALTVAAAPMPKVRDTPANAESPAEAEPHETAATPLSNGHDESRSDDHRNDIPDFTDPHHARSPAA